MDYISQHFRLNYRPMADKKAIVCGEKVRFTILTPRMIRVEYSECNTFEDRASQTFWYREQPVPEFGVKNDGKKIEVTTEYLHLSYVGEGRPFQKDTLSIKIRNIDKTWHYGDEDMKNLFGTARTLDGVDGELELEKGLVSESGWSILDDSKTLVFNDDYQLEQRKFKENKDIYFFGYGKDYIECIKDYYKIAGLTPLLPRWAFGNWWSRYWRYTDKELKNLMMDFEKKEVPLSVCIIDMDWHITQNKYSSGWTGYTWNRELFPEPQKFIQWLHSKGLKTSLNLHPADGVWPHEERYKEFAERMGINPEEEKQIEFDITDPNFIQGYFEILHHPMESEGVDFWWVDWQQGTKTKVEGLDPLYSLNHMHFFDIGRDGSRRPMIFSRWAGAGSHRYPIGFSGDTIVSWDSLKFQPYFTSTASNIGFGWWSHDIGGHMMGCEDSELYTRWVQFGVFSPIMRLHSSASRYSERRPWVYDAEVYRITKFYMQLRHAFIPYIYTMNYRNHKEGIPFITPLYYYNADSIEAYKYKNQYMFGSELMAVPVTSPVEQATKMARTEVWMPKGEWFNFFSGEYHEGDSTYAIYSKLEEVPIYAKAGAIIPLGKTVTWGGVSNPDSFDVYVFPGKDNSFTIYEDDGETRNSERGECCFTTLTQKYEGRTLTFTIGKPQGYTSIVSSNRNFTLFFRGVKNPKELKIYVKGIEKEVKYCYNNQKETLEIETIKLNEEDELMISIATDSDALISKRDRRMKQCEEMLMTFKMDSRSKENIYNSLTEIMKNPDTIDEIEKDITVAQRSAITECVKRTIL